LIEFFSSTWWSGFFWGASAAVGSVFIGVLLGELLHDYVWKRKKRR